MKKYIPTEIESKWQEKWQENGVFKPDFNNPKDKYYLLVEFTYPSGDLHIGHWFTFAVPDIIAKFKKMNGFDVFYPNGFDAFGLPAENAAIKNSIHPKDWTLGNVERMKGQYGLIGGSFDWDHEVITCLPEYYKWNQWIFLKMLEKGLVYKGKTLSNWCPVDQTVLANENVEAGKCWRCGAEVVQKEIDQWFLKITDYAEKLLWDQDGNGVEWPKATMEGQNNWIGKSEGILLTFKAEEDGLEPIQVFTTAIDTVFGVTFLVISPENPILSQFIKSDKKEEVEEYIKASKKKSEMERKENKDKTGVFTGSYVINPLNGDKVPLWVADYVLAGYGTGSVMAVPAHDSRDHEFAKKFKLEIKAVIKPTDGLAEAKVEEDGFWDYEEIKKFSEKALLSDSGDYSGLAAKEAKEKISNYIEDNNFGKRQVQYHLHDWSISRQRYWGTPIPIINCEKCGVVPVPEKDLPVELPYEVDFAPTGKPPLATAEDWLNVKCPNCEGPATREAETMDTFVDSSWYFLRYLSPKNNSEIVESEKVKNWLPVDIYFGGAEHTLGHTLYSRFFYKFLIDEGIIPDQSGVGEYAKKRINHGVILGPDGARMSKSKGNVINPDEQVKQYGADAVRLYLGFIGPYDIVAPWNPNGINGVYHFLQRVWGLQEKLGDQAQNLGKDDLKMMHQTIKKVTEEISEVKFNTAIAGLMEWLNHLSRKEVVSKEEYQTYLKLLAPFAPHITEEIWDTIGLGFSIHQQSWPKFDDQYLEEDTVKIVVQINGKVRETLEVQKDLLSNREVIEKMALESPKIQKILAGKNPQKIIYVPGKIVSLVV